MTSLIRSMRINAKVTLIEGTSARELASNMNIEPKAQTKTPNAFKSKPKRFSNVKWWKNDINEWESAALKRIGNFAVAEMNKNDCDILVSTVLVNYKSSTIINT